MKNLASIILLFIIPFALFGGSNEELFESANDAYANKKYADAINLYEQVIDDGFASAELYYNLGNAYYKTDNIAFAILNLERADKLSDDPDIDHNLAIARLKTIDKVSPVEQIFIVDWLDSVRGTQNSSGWSFWTLLFFWVMFLFISLLVFSRKSAIKKLSLVGILASLMLFVCTFYFAYSTHEREYVKEFAILTTPSAYVKSSPDSQSQDLFILHEGVKMEVLDQVGDWNKIRLDNGEIGWIDKSSFRLI